MKKILFYTGLILMVVSCENKNALRSNSCDVNDPVEDLPWLKQSIENWEQNQNELSKYFYVTQAVYDNQSVFILGNCCPVCNSVTPVYNCEGELLFNFGAKYTNEISNERIIWRPADSACSQ